MALFLCEPKMRVYQRLLAGDQEEAAVLFEELVEHGAVVEVYDTVLIPALAEAETHWQLGELHESKHQFILQSLKEMIQYRGERQQETEAKKDAANAKLADGDASRLAETSASQVCILCLPARSEADEIAAMMLAQILETKGCLVQSVLVASLAGDMEELAELRTADVVCVSATPPAAVMHARYLCRRLRRRLPQVNLVVGLWDAKGCLDKATERIGCGAVVVATLADAQAHVRRLTKSDAEDVLGKGQDQPDELTAGHV